MQAFNRFLPLVIAATAIAVTTPAAVAADDDGPTVLRQGETGAADRPDDQADPQDAPPAGNQKKTPPTKKTAPRSPSTRTAQRQQTPPKGQSLFGPNSGAKPPMPNDEAAANAGGDDANDALGEPLPKTLQEWKSRLTAEQFQITRMKGTERAFTGKYWKTDTPGTYKCVCCGEPLFTSGDKFLSECGWPAFSAPIDKKANGKVAETPDFTFGMRRVEVTCRKCGAQLGHVFNDGPPPTGIRYCINSASIVLDEAKPGAEEEDGGAKKPGK
jgi:peptide-methionine (R)-S-oxide reductase